MPLHRRFTAKNALIALLFWLVLALVLHLKAELWDPVEGQLGPADVQEAEEKPGQTILETGGNEHGDKQGAPKRRTAVVVASRKTEDATWLDDFFPQWEKNVYRVDNDSAPLMVPRNKGRESMVYLTFIIDNYESLPDNILFIHPNRYQWHNDDPDYDGLPMLRHFQISYLESEGYVNIRCAWSLGCPAEIKPLEEEGEHRAAVHAGGQYKQAFEELFPEREVPEYVGVSCCAQFAATKEKIQERKKSDYIRYRDWILSTDLEDDISGRVLEYSWHMIFGKDAVHCPSAQQCYCKVFGICELDCKNDGECPGRYVLPPYSTLPVGWPYKGWKGEERERLAPED